MYLSSLRDNYDSFSENEIKKIKNSDNLSELLKLNFYFKSIDYFDKHGGLYEYRKVDDTYFICENKTLYKFTEDKLVPARYKNKYLIWED